MKKGSPKLGGYLKQFPWLSQYFGFYPRSQWSTTYSVDEINVEVKRVDRELLERVVTYPNVLDQAILFLDKDGHMLGRAGYSKICRNFPFWEVWNWQVFHKTTEMVGDCLDRLSERERVEYILRLFPITNLYNSTLTLEITIYKKPKAFSLLDWRLHFEAEEVAVLQKKLRYL